MDLDARKVVPAVAEVEEASDLTALAERHSVVTRRALLAAGLGHDLLDRRRKAGLLVSVFPGVYSVGPFEGGDPAWLYAAWLYGGEDSVVSGRGAGAFWRMGQFGPIDVTTPRNRRGSGRVRFHRAKLPGNEWITRDGMKVTTPARTLLDLAGILTPVHLQRVFTEAEVLGHVDQPAIARLLAAHTGARGARTLAGLAGLDRGITRRGSVRSRLEIAYRDLVESTDLDVPVYNHRVEAGGRTYVLDAFHERARVAVELDGGQAHGATARFSTDRERDRHLLLIGIRTIRLAGDHFDRPDQLYGDMAALVGVRVPAA